MEKFQIIEKVDENVIGINGKEIVLGL